MRGRTSVETTSRCRHFRAHSRTPSTSWNAGAVSFSCAAAPSRATRRVSSRTSTGASGSIRYQNARGELIGEVRDEHRFYGEVREETVDAAPRSARGGLRGAGLPERCRPARPGVGPGPHLRPRPFRALRGRDAEDAVIPGSVAALLGNGRAGVQDCRFPPAAPPSFRGMPSFGSRFAR